MWVWLFPLAALPENAAEETADATVTAAGAVADVADDVPSATAEVAGDVADIAVDAGSAVTDAAGSAWNAATDLFDDDPELDGAALVRPTTAGNAEGTVRFRETDEGLMVMLSLRNLDPSTRHGFHIHQNPSCEAADTDGDGVMEPAGAAGGHWDPHHTNDHGAATDAIDEKHLGDLGNIEVSAAGTAEAEFLVDRYRPDEHSVVGHAIVVHGDRDDLESDPAGDSGKPVGCGVIGGPDGG